MSLDLQDPISLGRIATQVVQRHTSDAVDLARAVDLQAPLDAVQHARRHARKAAERLERRVDHASKRAAKRVHAESQRVGDATRSRRGRRALVVLLVVAGGAAVVAVLARRMQQVDVAETVPDPFGTAVRATGATGPVPEHDGSSAVTTG